MKKLQVIAFIILFFGMNIIQAQVLSDDFSDGDFTNNPVWTGDTQNFEILNGELHSLEDTVTNKTVLVTSAVQQTSVATTWEFDFRLDFNPSNSNRAFVYLQSDKPDLTDDLNGYYIQLGESTAVDAIKLYRQSGGSKEILISGIEGEIAESPSGKVRVTRSASAEWELFYDLDNTGFVSSGTAVDNTFESGNYTGVACHYTKTNSDAFYFDNFLVDPIYIDTDAPEFTSVIVQSPNQIELLFSELLASSSTNLSNFSISGNNIVSVVLNEVGTGVVITFENAFEAGVTQNITYTVTDLVGLSTSGSANFLYNPVQPYSVLITEIMAAPNASSSLPTDVEYVELYNSSNNDINLEGWVLKDNSATGEVELPAFELKAGEYITIAKETFEFEIAGIPTISGVIPGLNNETDLLHLYDKNGNLIFAVEYFAKWHSGNGAENGISLEMINLNTPCVGASNWTSSRDGRGGTPSMQNSVFDDSVNDETLPDLIRVGYVNEATIIAYFSEVIDVSKLTTANFNVDNGVGEPLLITPFAPLNNSVLISLNSLISAETIYRLTVNNICNCVGNVVGANNTAKFAIPMQAEAGDIIINEILFNQAVGSKDYVEIYNNSDKVIDLIKYSFTRDNFEVIGDNVIVANEPVKKTLTFTSYLLFPEDYLVLTEDADLVKQQYFTENKYAFLSVPGFPTLKSGADDDYIALKDSLGTLILDEVYFLDDWHYELIDNEKGVSLERISFDGNSNDGGNWHSASATVGYGTPGYLNSQYFLLPELEDDFSVEPKVFSPDGDSYKDFMLLNYELDEAGFTMNTYVFDDRGRQVKHLVKNELLGRTGQYKWDGDNDNGEKVNIGIYIIYIEIFDLNGKVERFKKTCTVAGMLE